MENLMQNEIDTILIHGERPDSTLVWGQTISPQISKGDLTVYFLLSPHLVFQHLRYKNFIKSQATEGRISVHLLYTVVPNRLFFKSLSFFFFSLLITQVAIFWISLNKKVVVYCRGFLGAAACTRIFLNDIT